ncbi:MAG TPA: FAD/NAD(P)-binding protein [Rhizomicrobium sp.]|nr:FAD/NAD(P)-binding protein [Rhizomicrobium sp.]
MERRGSRPNGQTRNIGVIGAGFAGTLFALKLAALRPEWTIFLIESRAIYGRGIAYGACSQLHLLNVPAGRMEIGLKPGFVSWLEEHRSRLEEALAESAGNLADAFVPRQLFGDYLERQITHASTENIRRIRGDAVKLLQHPRQIVLADGSVLPVDTVVLATGNLPPRLPFEARASARIVIDPWREGALTQIQASDSVLLLGTGLTMIDMLLLLRARGHRGPIHAVSRHGFLPKAHTSGGAWPKFLEPGTSPRQALQLIRHNVVLAEEGGIAWQRVFDAVRPVVAGLWHSWSIGQRAQFVRHLKALWDTHRHRIPERIAAVVDELLWSGTLTVTAGKLLAVDEHKEGLTALIRPRGKRAMAVEVDAIVNCTGPLLDLRRAHHALLGGLLEQGVIRSDPLGLGLDTADSAALGADGKPQHWLFALGPLTRPAWWEITAVPEINAQIDRLVRRIAHDDHRAAPPLASVFLDIGAGI